MLHTLVLSFELRSQVYSLIKDLLPCEINYIQEKKKVERLIAVKTFLNRSVIP